MSFCASIGLTNILVAPAGQSCVSPYTGTASSYTSTIKYVLNVPISNQSCITYTQNQQTGARSSICMNIYDPSVSTSKQFYGISPNTVVNFSSVASPTPRNLFTSTSSTTYQNTLQTFLAQMVTYEIFGSPPAATSLINYAPNLSTDPIVQCTTTIVSIVNTIFLSTQSSMSFKTPLSQLSVPNNSSVPPFLCPDTSLTSEISQCYTNLIDQVLASSTTCGGGATGCGTPKSCGGGLLGMLENLFESDNECNGGCGTCKGQCCGGRCSGKCCHGCNRNCSGGTLQCNLCNLNIYIIFEIDITPVESGSICFTTDWNPPSSTNVQLTRNPLTTFGLSNVSTSVALPTKSVMLAINLTC